MSWLWGILDIHGAGPDHQSAAIPHAFLRGHQACAAPMFAGRRRGLQPGSAQGRTGWPGTAAGGQIYFNHRGGPSMTKLGRSTTIRFWVFAMMVLAATSWAQTRPPI